MIVKAPFKDFTSYPSPTLPALSETSSMDAIPSDALEFFKVKAPVAVPVVNRKSPSVALEIVSSFSSVTIPPDISNAPATVLLPVTVRLSPTVTSDVECPIVTAIPEVSVATFIAPVALVMYEFDPSW